MGYELLAELISDKAESIDSGGFLLHIIGGAIQIGASRGTHPAAMVPRDTGRRRAGDYAFLPRVRHGRTALTAARWRIPHGLATEAARPGTWGRESWYKALSNWRERHRVPDRVINQLERTP